MNWIQSGIAFTTLVAAVTGGVTYFAKDSDLKLVEMRLDQKIRNDQMYDIQMQLWKFEDRYEGSPLSDWPHEDRERYRQLKYRFNELQQMMKGEKDGT